MKTIIIIFRIAIFALILASCSTAWHYQKIERKDPNFWSQFNDTIQIPFKMYDTIYQDGDTITIIERIEYRDTIIQTRTINPKSRFDYKSEALQLRHELKLEKEQTKQLKSDNRALKVKTRHDNRTKRTVTRQENKTDRTEIRKQSRFLVMILFSMIWFVIGLIIGMAFMFKYRMNVLRWLRGF